MARGFTYNTAVQKQTKKIQKIQKIEKRKETTPQSYLDSPGKPVKGDTSLFAQYILATTSESYILRYS